MPIADLATIALHTDTDQPVLLGSAMKLQTLGNARRAMAAGFSQKSVQGAAMQQGGVLVVMQDGTVAYRYASEAAGDHPPVEDVLVALEAAVSG